MTHSPIGNPKANLEFRHSSPIFVVLLHGDLHQSCIHSSTLKRERRGFCCEANQKPSLTPDWPNAEGPEYPLFQRHETTADYIPLYLRRI